MAKPLVDSAATRSFFAWSDRLDHDRRDLLAAAADELLWYSTSFAVDRCGFADCSYRPVPS
jgi:hypothetical protein